jgi:hypothetical protein
MSGRQVWHFPSQRAARLCPALPRLLITNHCQPDGCRNYMNLLCLRCASPATTSKEHSSLARYVWPYCGIIYTTLSISSFLNDVSVVSSVRVEGEYAVRLVTGEQS